METLRELLKQNGQDPNQAETLAAKYNYGSDLTAEDAKLIWDEESKGKLAKANKNGKVSRRRKKGRVKPVNFQDAVIHAAGESESEVQSLESQLQAHKGNWVQSRSQAIVDEIRSAPTEVMNSVAGALMEEKADAETFRQYGDELGSLLFPVEPPDATE